MIQFDASLLAIMVIFWATYFVARRLIFLPLTQLLDQRASEIASAQKVYSEALAESEAELEKQKANLAEALGDARSRRDEIRKQAQQRRSEIVGEARSSADSELAEARSELDETLRAEREKLSQLASSLAEKMAAKLLRRAS